MPGEHDVAAEASTLRLARVLATRMCHDLSGPLSGLGAALGEMPGDPEALLLARDAALILRQRIALLRAAWGEDVPPLGRDGLRDLSLGLPNAARLRVDLDGLAAGTPFAPAAARLVVNVMLLAAESLPGGGLLEFAGDPAGQVVACIAGRRAAWPAGLGEMLASVDAARQAVTALQGASGARSVQAPLTALLAHVAGVRTGLLLSGAVEAAPPLLLDFAVHT